MEVAVLLLTIILSAVSAGLATYRLNVCKERLSFRAKKAEEAYCAAEMLESKLTSFFEGRYSLLGISSQTPISEEMESVGECFAKLKMLIGFYFPALGSSFFQATSATATAYRSLKAFETAIDGKERQQQAQLLDATVVDLKDALDALKNNILAVGCKDQEMRPFTFFQRPAKPTNGKRILAVPA